MSSRWNQKRLWAHIWVVGLLSTIVFAAGGCPRNGIPQALSQLQYLVFESQWPTIPPGAGRDTIVEQLRNGTRTLHDIQLTGSGSCEFRANVNPDSLDVPLARLVFNGTSCTPGFNVLVQGNRDNEACSAPHGPTPRAIHIFSPRDVQVGQTTRDGYALVDTVDGETFTSEGIFFEFELTSIDTASGIGMGTFEFMASNQNDSNDSRILVVINGSFRLRIECGDPRYSDCLVCEGEEEQIECEEGFTFDPETGDCVPDRQKPIPQAVELGKILEPKSGFGNWWDRPQLIPTGEPAAPRPSTSASYGFDPGLAAPTVTSVTTTDNAVILTWNDANATQEGYLITVWERGSQRPPSEFRLPREARAAWFVSTHHGPLRPGAAYDILLFASGSWGLSSEARTEATLSAPSITIGAPTSGAIEHAEAAQGLAVWDADGDGIVRDAGGSAGAWPIFPASSGGQPVARAGNQFDRIQGGAQANVVVGYFVDEPLWARADPAVLWRVVAFHLFIDPATNRPTPVSVLYAWVLYDIPGTLVWVSPDVPVYTVQVTEGDPVLGTPNIVEGRVTAPTLASDGTFRVVEYTFRLALLER